MHSSSICIECLSDVPLVFISNIQAQRCVDSTMGRTMMCSRHTSSYPACAGSYGKQRRWPGLHVQGKLTAAQACNSSKPRSKPGTKGQLVGMASGLAATWQGWRALRVSANRKAKLRYS